MVALDRAVRALDAKRLLTPEEAAPVLGVQLPLVVELWCKKGSLQCQRTNGWWLVPLSELERFANDDEVEMIRVLDKLHDASAELGSDEGMSEEELELLSASRPGTLLWQR